MTPAKVTADSLTVLGRRPGRPRVEEPGTCLSAWVTQREYDRLAVLASQQRKSLSRLVSEVLRRETSR